MVIELKKYLYIQKIFSIYSGNIETSYFNFCQAFWSEFCMSIILVQYFKFKLVNHVILHQARLNLCQAVWDVIVAKVNFVR